MNQTTYRSQLSPYQPKLQHPIERMREKAYDVQDDTHPVRALVKRCLGVHQLTALVEEDLQTLKAMAKVDGLISFLCTLSAKDGRILAQGRGSAVLGPNTRFLSRTVACAFNASIADAAIRCTRVLDTLRDKSEVEIEEESRDEAEPATDKQREYLRQLVRKIGDAGERTQWESRLSKITKDEASRAIETFRK